MMGQTSTEFPYSGKTETAAMKFQMKTKGKTQLQTG